MRPVHIKSVYRGHPDQALAAYNLIMTLTKDVDQPKPPKPPHRPKPPYNSNPRPLDNVSNVWFNRLGKCIVERSPMHGKPDGSSPTAAAPEEHQALLNHNGTSPKSLQPNQPNVVDGKQLKADMNWNAEQQRRNSLPPSQSYDDFIEAPPVRPESDPGDDRNISEGVGEYSLFNHQFGRAVEKIISRRSDSKSGFSCSSSSPTGASMSPVFNSAADVSLLAKAPGYKHWGVGSFYGHSGCIPMSKENVPSADHQYWPEVCCSGGELSLDRPHSASSQKVRHHRSLSPLRPMSEGGMSRCMVQPPTPIQDQEQYSTPFQPMTLPRISSGLNPYAPDFISTTIDSGLVSFGDSLTLVAGSDNRLATKSGPDLVEPEYSSTLLHTTGSMFGLSSAVESSRGGVGVDYLVPRQSHSHLDNVTPPPRLPQQLSSQGDC